MDAPPREKGRHAPLGAFISVITDWRCCVKALFRMGRTESVDVRGGYPCAVFAMVLSCFFFLFKSGLQPQADAEPEGRSEASTGGAGGRNRRRKAKLRSVDGWVLVGRLRTIRGRARTTDRAPSLETKGTAHLRAHAQKDSVLLLLLLFPPKAFASRVLRRVEPSAIRASLGVNSEQQASPFARMMRVGLIAFTRIAQRSAVRLPVALCCVVQSLLLIQVRIFMVIFVAKWLGLCILWVRERCFMLYHFCMNCGAKPPWLDLKYRFCLLCRGAIYSADVPRWNQRLRDMRDQEKMLDLFRK